MRYLKENALRTREILRREQSPLPRGCEAVVLADIERVLSGYFSQVENVCLKIEKGGRCRIVFEAEFGEIKPFGVIRG